MITTITIRRVAVAGLVAAGGLSTLTLTGCTTQESPAAAASSEAAPSPVRIDRPEPDQSCTVEIATTEGAEHPDRATITCGEKTRTVAGDFRDRTSNVFDPAATDGIERVVMVGGEARAWMTHPEGSCVIIWREGQAPAQCQVTVTPSPESPTGDSTRGT